MHHRRMAFGAVLSELALMEILVAIGTGNRADAVDIVWMAERTLSADLILTVEAQEREARIHVVAEVCLAGTAFNVAAGAGLIRKLVIVDIFVGVATRASSLFVIELALPLIVAALAAQLLMFTCEAQPELGVVDLRSAPTAS